MTNPSDRCFSFCILNLGVNGKKRQKQAKGNIKNGRVYRQWQPMAPMALTQWNKENAAKYQNLSHKKKTQRKNIFRGSETSILARSAPFWSNARTKHTSRLNICLCFHLLYYKKKAAKQKAIYWKTKEPIKRCKPGVIPKMTMLLESNDVPTSNPFVELKLRIAETIDALNASKSTAPSNHVWMPWLPLLTGTTKEGTGTEGEE